MLKIGKYRHYKDKMYEVIGVGRHSEDIEKKFVVYKSLYDHPDFEKGQIWVRPMEIFVDSVNIEGREIKRFEFVEED